jgi:hypothetical protein
VCCLFDLSAIAPYAAAHRQELRAAVRANLAHCTDERGVLHARTSASVVTAKAE